jgi:hypothetical protein
MAAGVDWSDYNTNKERKYNSRKISKIKWWFNITKNNKLTIYFLLVYHFSWDAEHVWATSQIEIQQKKITIKAAIIVFIIKLKFNWKN